MSFYNYKIGNREYLRSTLFSKNTVSHGFTSSVGGVSHGKINGFNFGFRVSDDPNSVKENYRILADDLDFDLNKTVLSKQTHTDNIRVVTVEDSGKGITKESDIEDTDGLITNIPGMTLVVFSADCVPILFYDKVKGVIGAVHSGWRGTVKKIGAKAVEKMQTVYGCNPKDICAAIGPSIGPCCFEFGSDAEDYFEDKYLTKKNNGKYLVDIWSVCRDTLLNCGISDENIDVSKVCTVCNCDKYYSYRKHKDNTGRQVAAIMLKEKQ